MSNRFGVIGTGKYRAIHMGLRYYVALGRLWRFRVYEPIKCNEVCFTWEESSDFLVNSGETCADALNRHFAAQAEIIKKEEECCGE